MYIVTRYFTDAQDNEHPYSEGDEYPRKGLSVSEERINSLMNGNNFQRVSLIKKVDKPIKKEEKKEEVVWTAEDINKLAFFKLKSVAKQNGVSIEGKDAAEIKAELIEKLGL